MPVPGHGAREGLEGAALPGGAGDGAVRDGALPADAGDVGAVGDRGGLGGPVDEGRGRVARGGVALGQDRDLDGLDGAAVARRAGLGAVARPAEPSELGGVDAVPDGVALRQPVGQPDPQGLDGAGPAGGAGGAAVADGGLPADAGDVGLDGYRVGAEGIAGRRVGQDEAQRLEGEPPAGRAGDPAAGDGAHPADIGDVGGIGQRDGRGPIGPRGLRLGPVGLGGLGLGGLGLDGIGLRGLGLGVARGGGGGVGRGPAQGQGGRDRQRGRGTENSFHGASHGKSP